MILVSDAVAEVDRTTHEAELRTMARIFADVKYSRVSVAAAQKSISPPASIRWLS